MIPCDWAIQKLEALAPLRDAEDWDNTGLMVGDRHMQTQAILLALDLTDEVIQEAQERQAGLIITHHPLIFRPLKQITTDTPLGRRIIRLLRSGITAYAAHTNLDAANGGTNDVLCDLLGLTDVEKLPEAPLCAGSLPNERTLADMAALVKEKLGLSGIRYTGDGLTKIRRICICGGAGADHLYVKAAADAHCDVYITGDIKYHEAQAALDYGLCMIDATHDASEWPVIHRLRQYLLDEAEQDSVDVAVHVSAAGKRVFHLA